jgi:translation initiation factor 3 subunit H
MASVEKLTSRGKAVLVVHDKSKGVAGDLSLKGWRLSEGVREAVRGGKWDTAT